jgi:hypothetical protein
MLRLLCPRVLVLCGVALLGLSGCLGSTPDAVLPSAAPHQRRHGAAGICGPA